MNFAARVVFSFLNQKNHSTKVYYSRNTGTREVSLVLVWQSNILAMFQIYWRFYSLFVQSVNPNIEKSSCNKFVDFLWSINVFNLFLIHMQHHQIIQPINMVDLTLVSICLILGNQAAGAGAAKHHHFENLVRIRWTNADNSQKTLT